MPKINKKTLFHKFLNYIKLNYKKYNKESFLSDINNLLELYEQKSLISGDEKSMITNISNLDNKIVKSIMTPRSDLVTIDIKSNLEDIKNIIIEDGHTRIPVYKDDIDSICGFIHTKDLSKFLWLAHKDFDIKKYLRKIIFVPGSIKILDLMKKMKLNRTHIAIVLDEFGGVDGVITIEDLIEEIVGNIEDEHDISSDNLYYKVKKINNNIYQFGARVDIAKVEESLDISINLKNSTFQTVGGLALYLFQRIPQINESIKYNNLKFRIISSNNKSIELVEIRKI